MRRSSPLWALPILVTAACASVPGRFQGQYIRESALAIVQHGGVFAGRDHANLTLDGELAVLETQGDTQAMVVVGAFGDETAMDLKLVERGREARFMEVQQSETRMPPRRPEALEVDASWSIAVEKGRAVLSIGDERWVRIADALPAAAGMSAAAITSAALFSRGFTTGSEVWVIVGRPKRGVADLRRTGEEVWTQFRGGFDAPAGGPFGAAPLMQIGHEAYLLEQRPGGMRLVPAVPGPSAKAQRGRAIIDLAEMDEPPLVVLGDQVAMVLSPAANAPGFGRLAYLTPVAPWVRSDELARVGSLEGHWYLVQAEERVGWVFGAWLGQRLRPARGAVARQALWEVEPVDSNLRLAFGRGRDGPLCRFETPAGSLELQKKAPPCDAGERLRCSTPAAPFWGDGERAAVLLDELNADARVDLVCVIEKAGQLALCPVLSAAGEGYRPGGCVLQPGPELPAFGAADENGDGFPDLIFGGEAPILWLPDLGRFDGAVESRLEVGLPSEIAFTATDVRRDAAGNIVGVTVQTPALRELPPAIGMQRDLTELLISSSPLRALPPEVAALSRLARLYVEDGELAAVPAFLGELAALRDLDLSGNRIEEAPEALLRLTGLRRLDLSRNQIGALPAGLGALGELAVLELGGNRIAELPASIGQLAALRVLNLYGNQLAALPEPMRRLTALEELDLARNLLAELPGWIGELRSLRGLGLANNRLTALPPGIGGLSELTRLDLTGNPLTSLPSAMQKLDALGEVHWESRPCGRQAAETTKAFLERCTGLPVR